MKWFKHPTDWQSDENVADYLDSCGKDWLSGYGFYMTLLETVSANIKQGTDECSVSYSLKNWCKQTGIHHRQWTKYTTLLADAGLIRVATDNNKVRVSIPQLIDLVDEYTRKLRTKSGQNPANVRVEESREEEKSGKEVGSF